MSTSRRTILFLIFFTTAANAGAQGVPELKTVIERAQNYVKGYEEQLGTLIGQEDYQQTAKWDRNTQRRRMSSDFLLTR